MTTTNKQPAILIDMTKANTAEELHTILAEGLGFPDYYGKNWDAFWDVVRDPEGHNVDLPRYVNFVGGFHLQQTLPRENELMGKIFLDLYRMDRVGYRWNVILENSDGIRREFPEKVEKCKIVSSAELGELARRNVGAPKDAVVDVGPGACAVVTWIDWPDDELQLRDERCPYCMLDWSQAYKGTDTGSKSNHLIGCALK